MVFGKIGGYLALGLVGAFLLNSLIRPKSALATGAALDVTGGGIASIGQGIGSSLASIGSGSAKLFDPLFTLRDLVFSSDVSTAAGISPVQQNQGETNQGRLTPSSSTITWSNGTTASVPSLSSAAKAHYSALGVSVS